MEGRETLRIALRTIRSHRLRSALTVLGVVIGIASVVTFATFGASVQADVIGQIEGSTANNVYAFGSPEGEGFDVAFQPIFTERDVARLAEVDGVRAVIPRGQLAVQSIARGNDSIATGQVTASVPATVANDSLVAGRSFRQGASEAVIDRRAATAFEENVTVGDEITLTRQSGETQTVTVVGIVNGTRGELPVSNFASQPRVVVPTDPFYDTVAESPSAGVLQRAYPQVTVVADPARAGEVRAAVERALSDTDANQLKADDVELVARTGGDFVDRIGDVIDRITRFVTGIAVIALVVGAVGIANIMLVSVTERTREIGIMKAVGARNRDVMQLFLLEAALLGGLGAVLGLPLGLAVGWAATRYAEVSFALAPVWMALSVVVGVLVGVVSGLYPAWRAARIEPIDALRRE
ncbi:ABC transporter permease [Halomicrobium salinisoli]|uniref:ABC transporter permease n=1 Tax=Halomicrobium salinisoli TaxID=2878391 RepID=UPI001CF0B486|nr:FtsX-like permease family protein [Halomicrobium salinisoli]